MWPPPGWFFFAAVFFFAPGSRDDAEVLAELLAAAFGRDGGTAAGAGAEPGSGPVNASGTEAWVAAGASEAARSYLRSAGTGRSSCATCSSSASTALNSSFSVDTEVTSSSALIRALNRA